MVTFCGTFSLPYARIPLGDSLSVESGGPRGSAFGHFSRFPGRPFHSLLIQPSRCIGDVGLVHDVVTIKHRGGLPATNLHDRLFRNAEAPHVAAACSAKIVQDQAQVSGRAGFALFTL